MFIYIACIVLCLALLIALYFIYKKESLTYHERILSIVFREAEPSPDVNGRVWLMSINVDSGMLDIYDGSSHIDTNRRLSEEERMRANHIFIYLTNNAVQTYELTVDVPFVSLQVSQDGSVGTYHVAQLQGLPREIQMDVKTLINIMNTILPNLNTSL